MRRVAIIPARSGSKGLVDKNIIDLCGKHLIGYSIEAAINSGIFERVIVSTDSEKYREIAESYGAEVMMRGEALSSDTATSYVVIEDVLKRLPSFPDYFVVLQPTSPMRNASHIQEAVALFEEKCETYDFLVSMKEAEHTNILVKPIDEDGSLKYFDADFSNYRRQGYKDYTPNGAIYIGKCQEYLTKKHFFGAKSIGYIMCDKDSIDIDTELDYEIAKVVMRQENENAKKV